MTHKTRQPQIFGRQAWFCKFCSKFCKKLRLPLMLHTFKVSIWSCFHNCQSAFPMYEFIFLFIFRTFHMKLFYHVIPWRAN